MRVLLPPSEAKNPGGRGRPLSARPPHPLLGGDRERVLDALGRLLAGPRRPAVRALLLPPAAVDAALAADAAARTGGTLPALRRYAGVVYDGLASAGLDGTEHRLAARSTLIFSGLLGVVRGDEPVPDYRVPAKAVLPGIGVAGTFWRPVLDEVLPILLGRGLVIDLRSSDYVAMWRPRGALAERVVQVRVLSPLPGGGRGVVSYPSKFAKGRLAAALVRRAAAGGAVRTA
ncbi:MAG: peroxide stress protein YaaA, partial [Jatrophihabitantaceae bacterium]